MIPMWTVTVVYRKSVYAPASPWLTPLIGAFLVGLIGLLSVIGFNNLVQRMPINKPAATRLAPKLAPPSPSKGRQTRAPVRHHQTKPRATVKQQTKPTLPKQRQPKAAKRRRTQQPASSRFLKQRPPLRPQPAPVRLTKPTTAKTST